MLDWLADRLTTADFVIRHRPGVGTTVRGLVPGSKKGAIGEFFARDLRPSGPVAVRGSWGPGRALRLSFSGPLDGFARQQARNFLLELLR